MTLHEWLLEQPVTSQAMNEVLILATEILYMRMQEADIKSHLLTSRINNDHLDLTVQINNVRH